MRRNRVVLLTTLAFNLICLIGASAFSQNSNQSQPTGKIATIEEAVDAGNKSIAEDNWALAESYFRQAIKFEPKQSLWHIQLLIALGQQKKWTEAFKEAEIVTSKLGVADWLLTANQEMPDGKVAFLNTDTFRDEKLGIVRYVKAVKERKKLDSISRDIGVKLDEFANQNKLALTYDISKFKNKPFVTGKTVDVTSDFIAYYNERSKD